MNNSVTNDLQIIDFIEGSSVLVVIVSYKTGELVIDTLKSLVPELSTQPKMRAIVVDNTCGKDAEITQRAINENGWKTWVKIQKSPKNGGFSFGNNLAIRCALKTKVTPKYIWLLNPDTQIYPEAGTSLIEFLNENKSVGIVGSSLFHADGTEWSEAFRFPSILSEIENSINLGPVSRLLEKHTVAYKMGNHPCQVGWVSGASLMIRTEVFNATNIFDEEYFLYYEETDFCLSALKKGWPTWYVPSSKVMHISGQSTGVTGVAGSPKRLPQYMFDSRSRYFRKNHGILYATVADAARVMGLICYKIIRLVRGRPNEHHQYLLLDTLRNSTLIRYLRRKV